MSCKPGGYIRKNRKILDDVWGTICNWLVVSTRLKIMKVNRKDYPIYYGNIKKGSKPPSRHALCWWKGDVVILRNKFGHWHSTGEWYGPRIDGETWGEVPNKDTWGHPKIAMHAI